MSNPNASPALANARRQEIVSEKIMAASEWLDEVRDGKKYTRREFIEGFNGHIGKVMLMQYAKLRNIHPRTARKYLDAAIKETK